MFARVVAATETTPVNVSIVIPVIGGEIDQRLVPVPFVAVNVSDRMARPRVVTIVACPPPMMMEGLTVMTTPVSAVAPTLSVTVTVS